MKKKLSKKIYSQKKFTKTSVINISITLGIFILTIISVATGTYIWKSHNIRLGSISSERFVADREVVNLVATEKAKDAVRAENKTPLYKQDNDVGVQAVEQIQSFFNTLRTARKTNLDEKAKKAAEALKQNQESISAQNINKDGDETNNILIDNSNFLNSQETQETQTTSYNYEIPVFLTAEKFNILISLDYDKLNDLENDILAIVADVMETGIKQDLDSITKSNNNIQEEINKLELDSELNKIAYTIASSVIKPNVIIDEEATQQLVDKKVSEVKDIVIKRGQKIVDKDEIITEEIYTILDSLGYIEKDEWNSKSIVPLVGLAIIIALLQAFIYEYIRTNNKKLWTLTKEKTMLFTMYCLIILIIRIMTGIQYYMVIPISLFGMLVAMLIDLPLAILLNIVVSIVGTLIYNGDIQFLIYFVISGTFSCILTKHTYERNNTIKAASTISIINAVVIFGIGFLFEKTLNEELVFKSLLAMLSGIIALITMTGSLPFWEAAFDAITPIKLLELTNPNQPILKRLIIEAPGTYHHSIIVANLAEMAAMDIGADGALARAGAYYHDIGKLKYPNYFSENQVGENPHDYLLPLDSTKIIIGHVKDGHIYAIEEKLPKIVRDMIIQHHGNTLVKYFYYKAKKDFPDEIIKEEQYRYPGSIPQFKEAAIVMLADTVEAAVRSMFNQGKSINEIKVIVGNLIKDKLDDGQLTESDLTIRDLDTIKNSFIKVFKGMYHERIAYPKEATKSIISDDKEKKEEKK